MSPSWGLEDLAVYVTACALLLPSPLLRLAGICLTAEAGCRRDEHHSVSAAERRLLRAAGAGPVQLTDVPQPWGSRKARKRRPHRQLAAGQRERSAERRLLSACLTNRSCRQGQAVTLAGRNLFVTDSDIYSSGDVVGTRGNGDDIGAAYMHIARNRFLNGGATHYGISWKQSIFEDNVATGVSPTA